MKMMNLFGYTCKIYEIGYKTEMMSKECNSGVWAAVFTFNPYLLISLNEIIDINNSFIDINQYGHSIHLY